MNISISVDGNINDISEIAEAIKSRLPAALLDGAEAVADTARGMCPVRTGQLRSSISTSSSGESAQVFADADYAIFVELGTYKMAAQPFLVPALSAAESSVSATILGGLGI